MEWLGTFLSDFNPPADESSKEPHESKATRSAEVKAKKPTTESKDMRCSAKHSPVSTGHAIRNVHLENVANMHLDFWSLWFNSAKAFGALHSAIHQRRKKEWKKFKRCAKSITRKNSYVGNSLLPTICMFQRWRKAEIHVLDIFSDDQYRSGDL